MNPHKTAELKQRVLLLWVEGMQSGWVYQLVS